MKGAGELSDNGGGDLTQSTVYSKQMKTSHTLPLRGRRIKSSVPTPPKEVFQNYRLKDKQVTRDLETCIENLGVMIQTSGI